MTAWPLVWTVEPSSPNWSGTVGDTLTFNVSAIPDPDFVPDVGEGGGTITPPSPPTNIQLTVIDSTLDVQYYTISNDTLSVSVDDVRIFLPYTSIKFEKDGEIFQVHYEEELNQIGYDFVFEFIPFPNAFDTRYITLRATSTSTQDLVGTFSFQINNNFDAVRSSLLGIVENGESFLSSLEDGDGTPPSFDEAPINEVTTITPVFTGNYKEPDYDELFEPNDGVQIDQTIRNDDASPEDVIGDGGILSKTPKPKTPKLTDLPENPSDEDLQKWFDNLGD